MRGPRPLEGPASACAASPRPACAGLGRSRLVAALLAVVALAACGDDGASDAGRTGSDPGRAGNDAGVEHIHGLGVNPADDALMIATHSGLFRAAPGRQTPERVGDRRQDTMGFTVVGPDRFLGSGHPDLRDDLPPLLGLIRSDDAGRSWQPVSLLGQADFHVLRTAGPRIYGVNSADGRLLVSDDGGHRWAARTPPGPLLDLAAHPDVRDRIVVSGEDGLHVSRDAGRRWRRLASDRAGLLAWPAEDALYLVDASGAVHRSRDGGTAWAQVGTTGGQPAAFVHAGRALYVALHTKEVKVSRDGGRSWQTRIVGQEGDAGG